jgi:hypothetical protein
MKGIVFVEFIELVDSHFSLEMSERLIEMSDLPSKGVYTSVGTYDFKEMLTLLDNLSTLTGRAPGDLLKDFGRHLFERFFTNFPAFFEGITSSFEFLSRVDGVVHLEVRKLYEDAEPPTFVCTFPGPDRLHLKYQSKRNLPDLAEGLILACIDHYGEQCSIQRQSIEEDPPATLFIISSRK